MRRALVALALGVAVAVGFAALLVIFSPLQTVTDEIAARTRPNLFDLVVALLSGLAGTFATLRSKQGAIVGVAIATAVMPPLATLGFGIATANADVAGGAAFLFFTNLMAIALACAAMARLYGFGASLSPRQGAVQGALILATLVALVVGLPIGILMSRHDGVQRVVAPVLDVMQTMPSFVYLIPVVMLLGIGKVPGLIAVVIYAIPPVIRFTNLGIRLVAADMLEAADAFGSSALQKLWKVQLPLALPTIMGGINQTIMLALSMVVIASMIGVQGLGQPVLKAISNQYFTLGVFNGMAIVGIAIVFDRISQAYGKRLQRHLEVSHG